MTDQQLQIPDHVYADHAAAVLNYLAEEAGRLIQELDEVGWKPAADLLRPHAKRLAEASAKTHDKALQLQQKPETTDGHDDQAPDNP